MDDQNTKNRRLKEKLVIDSESYDNLSQMLDSTEEDQVVALECIKNVDQKKSLIYTLFLRKNNLKTFGLWHEHCSKVLKYHASLGISKDSNAVSYNDIMKIMKEQDNKEENVKVFMKEFARFLKDSMSTTHFEFIDDIQIEITLKKQDEKQK
jgi:hypothetical protein